MGRDQNFFGVVKGVTNFFVHWVQRGQNFLRVKEGGPEFEGQRGWTRIFFHVGDQKCLRLSPAAGRGPDFFPYSQRGGGGVRKKKFLVFYSGIQTVILILSGQFFCSALKKSIGPFYQIFVFRGYL